MGQVNLADNRLEVLGPIRLQVAGERVNLGGLRQRTLFALLTINTGGSFSTDRLIDELWPESPPPTARNTIQSYVTRLRKLVGKGRISSTTTGYRFDGGGWSVDAEELEASLSPTASGLDLKAALDQWRGLPYEDAAETPTINSERVRLEEIRLQAVERWAGLEVDQGRADQVLTELERLVNTYPLRESLWRSLMVALYRSGRQADALAAYQRLRRLLAEELGIDPSNQLKALEEQILRHDPSLEARPEARPLRSNLPAERSSFIGREAELLQLSALLRLHRLVTLLGPGGAGKTRLALKAAAAQSGPVVFVDLSLVGKATSVGQGVAAALGVTEEKVTDIIDQVRMVLSTTPMLLVLDNCEPVVSQTRDLVDRLLDTCPGLTVLATSRLVLDARGEVVSELLPFTLPAEDAPTELTDVNEAICLFVDRARAAMPDFQLDESTRPAVISICRALGGLPLAIELAAASVRVMGPRELDRRLNERLDLLEGGAALPQRHRTLRAAFEGSYELLQPRWQAALQALSLLNGPFDLDLAAAAAGAEEGEAIQAVRALLDASLLRSFTGQDPTTYAMLDTVRHYARDYLGGRREEVEERLVAHIVALARQARNGLRGPEAPQLVARLRRLADNLSPLVQRVLEENRAAMAAEIVGGLVDFWQLAAMVTEGENLTARVVEVARSQGEETVLLQALVARLQWYPLNQQEVLRIATEIEDLAIRLNRADLVALGRLGRMSVHDLAFEEGLAALRVLEEVGDHRSVVFALEVIGSAQWWTRPTEEAYPTFSRLYAIGLAADDRLAVMAGLHGMINSSFQADDSARLAAIIEEMDGPAREIGIEWWHPLRLHWLGALAEKDGKPDQAFHWLNEALAETTRRGMVGNQSFVLSHLSVLSWTQGDIEGAYRYLRSFAEMIQQAGNTRAAPFILEMAASVATAQSRERLAARLLGAAEKAREPGGATMAGVPMPSWDLARYSETIDLINSALGERVLEFEKQEGRILPLDRALSLALHLDDQASATSSSKDSSK